MGGNVETNTVSANPTRLNFDEQLLLLRKSGDELLQRV